MSKNTTFQVDSGSNNYFVTSGQLVSSFSPVIVAVPHTLGVIPKYIKFHASGFYGDGNSGTNIPFPGSSYCIYDVSNGTYNGISENTNLTSHLFRLNGGQGTGVALMQGTITNITSTNIEITINPFNGNSCGYVMELT